MDQMAIVFRFIQIKKKKKNQVKTTYSRKLKTMNPYIQYQFSLKMLFIIKTKHKEKHSIQNETNNAYASNFNQNVHQK